MPPRAAALLRLVPVLRIVLACALADAASSLLGFPAPFWAMVTAVVVTQPGLAATLTAGRDRVIGTLIGALAGLAVIEAARQGASLNAAFWVALVPLAGLTAWRPNLRLCCITLIVVVLVPAAGGPSFGRPLDRVAEILIGTLASIVVSLVIRWGRGEPR